jgi:hypothetical protein
MVARGVPSEKSKLSPQDAVALAETYIRLREPVRALAVELGIAGGEFDAVLPEHEKPRQPYTNPRVLLELGSEASRAAALLRSLAGYVEGLIEAVVLDERITMDQVKAAREAARQPPGFSDP